MPSAIGASHASPNSPAFQVRASSPEAKGAEFGALVAAAAKAKHAPPPPVVEEPPASIETPPADTETDAGQVVDVVA